MALIVSLLIFGSGLISLLVSWQVKFIPPEFGALARYNFLITQLIFSANLALGTAFVRAHVIMKNLPFFSRIADLYILSVSACFFCAAGRRESFYSQGTVGIYLDGAGDLGVEKVKIY